MDSMDRRNFLRKAGAGAVSLAAAGPWVKTGLAKNSPNETINVAVIGLNNRGSQHAENFAKMPNVNVALLCDIDENLLPKGAADIEKITGKKPRTEKDLRKVMEDKEIDVVSVATCNHWHALATIWACQAGKDVYVEKPCCYNIFEGRKMIEAARKYKRIVQVGSQNRSGAVVRSAMDFLHQGKLGELYMVKCAIFRPRDTIGRGKVTAVPPGVHFNLWLGPAPDRPFIDNRFHYNWHWYWDTGNGETGNNGPHYTDMARWALQKYDHPRKIQSIGGYYQWDCDQETPNMQMSVLEYADGKLVQLEIRGLYTTTEIGMQFYGAEGWMRLGDGKWETFYGRKNEPGESMSDAQAAEKYQPLNIRGTGDEPHFENFISAVRSRKKHDLTADILEGHLSASMCHLSNIAYRTGRTIYFDSESETIVGDEEAGKLLTREYRYPFIVPDEV